MPASHPNFPRRRTLIVGTAALMAKPIYTFAQARRSPLAELQVTQILDMSPAQQNLSRDYATGVRLAFAELKDARLPLPRLVVLETDGSAAAVIAAARAVQQDSSQLALVGVAGEGAAIKSAEALKEANADLPMIAPWLSDSRFDDNPSIALLFASRNQQLKHVLSHLAMVGVTELGLVYPNAEAAAADAQSLEGLSRELKVQARVLPSPGAGELERFGRTLPLGAPYFLVFLGGSLELAQFTAGLAVGRKPKYVICLSEVDPNTFIQTASDMSSPVVFTQVVPNPRASRLPVVRAYQQALNRFFDEPPSPMSLAGYIAGRYAGIVLSRTSASASRQQLLVELKQRRAVEVNGWPIAFANGARGSSYVDQVLLGKGKYIGS